MANREKLTYIAAGCLRGSAPSGDLIVIWHPDKGRTGYRLWRKGQWHDWFEREKMEEELGIPVRVKKSGQQKGQAAETVLYAAWRCLADRYNAVDADVEYSHLCPADLEG